jgi:hypothetical protein
VRKLNAAISESKEGIRYTREIGNELDEMIFLSFKAEAQQLAGDLEGASDSISNATEIYETQGIFTLSVFLGPYVAARLFIDVDQLNENIRFQNSTAIVHTKKQTCKSAKLAIRVSRKYAPYRIKIWRLVGVYFWLIGKHTKALKWWGRTIEEGERLGARPDLSRTYLEIGKRLIEPQSKYKELNGIDAKGYFEKARSMFKEMKLRWDLDELDKISSNNEHNY